MGRLLLCHDHLQDMLCSLMRSGINLFSVLPKPCQIISKTHILQARRRQGEITGRNHGERMEIIRKAEQNLCISYTYVQQTQATWSLLKKMGCGKMQMSFY